MQKGHNGLSKEFAKPRNIVKVRGNTWWRPLGECEILRFLARFEIWNPLWRHAEIFNLRSQALVVGLSRPGAGKRGPKKNYWRQSPAYQGTQGSRSTILHDRLVGRWGHAPLSLFSKNKKPMKHRFDT